jgi:hypothetical protein
MPRTKKFKILMPRDQILKSNKPVNISNWEKINHEWRGTRDKVNLRHPYSGTLFLVKKPKYGDEEILIELFNSYLAKNLNIKTADYFLCRYNGELRIASKSFINPSDGSCELWEMRELLCYHSENPALLENKYGRDPNVLKEHNIDYLFKIITEEFGEKVLPGFFKMIAFDCLIGHGDRHWENYGFLIKQNQTLSAVEFSFAPLYDTAYSFLLGNTEDKIKTLLDNQELETSSWHRPNYKGISKITVPDQIKSNHFDLLEYIFENKKYSKYLRYIVEIVNSYDKVIVESLLKKDPFKDFLSAQRMQVIKVILETRINLMKEIIR